MNPYEMVVLIILIIAVGGVIRSKNKHKGKAPKDFESFLNQSGVSKQLRKVDLLEERVKILERIVTDRKHSLADEIDNL